MSKNDSSTNYPEAAICGLYCGNCPSYGNGCGGCLSSEVAEECHNCFNGFRACAAERGITRCSECCDMPCERLENFSKQHVVNGIVHHEHVIRNLIEMRDEGIEKFLRRMDDETRCPNCSKRIIWYDKTCPSCAKS